MAAAGHVLPSSRTSWLAPVIQAAEFHFKKAIMKLSDLDKGVFASLKVSNYVYHRGTIPVVQEGVGRPSKLTIRADLAQGTLEFDLPDDLLPVAQRLMACADVVVVKVALFGKDDSALGSLPLRKVVVEICSAKTFGERAAKKPESPKKAPKKASGRLAQP